MFFICNILLILILAVWFLRFAQECGFRGKGKLFSFCSCTTSYKGEHLTKEDVFRVAIFAFGIRILV